VRQNILDYYSDANAPITTKKDSKAWAQLMKDLAALQNLNP
jgi:hypothetical protein